MASSPDASAGLADSLVQLTFGLHGLISRLAEEHDLSPVQLRLLGVLEDREVGMQQLGRILELEKSSTTGLVDRAERRGLVRRVAVPDNRRAVHVTVTDEGRDLVVDARRAVREEVAQLAESLSPRRQREVERAVAALLAAYVDRHGVPS